MKGMKVHKTVELTYSAEDWELYTASYPAECAKAAAEINRAIEVAVNAGKSCGEVRREVGPVFGKWADMGACDTEPRGKLDDVLDHIFGEETCR